jgi:GNAT superfamily N-acetyltransferase
VSWRAARAEDGSALVEFLCRDEIACAGASARVRTAERGCTAYLDEEGGGIRGALVATTNGLVLPVLPYGVGDPAGLAAVLGEARWPVHSIMGASASVKAAEAAMPIPPGTRIAYRLMSLAREAWRGSAAHASAAAAAEGVRVHRSGIGDAALLFPLQRAYELEEVVIDRGLWSDAACLRMLRQGLRDDLIFHVVRDGRALAKAGTNARGYAVDQIGGVFTVPAERGRGLARIVMAALLEAIFAEKPIASLFVKTTNTHAIALYERLAFRTVGGYAISYFGI